MSSKTCDGCHINEVAAYETAMAFAERTTVRLWVIIIILAVMLIGTNIGWLLYESQFETVSDEYAYEIQQKAVTGSNYSVIGNGNINGSTED
ncbi:hypothetical protein IJI69_00310 [Candidatus Saccharibacteria bacterium]|nr:hypothetical protein [Candidatus Saccharibacteria bacterium]MBQ6127132.1 hypothetical protein [Candidatus Saccharibacteria bacterium]